MTSLFSEIPVRDTITPEDVYNIAIDWVQGIYSSRFYQDKTLLAEPFSDLSEKKIERQNEVIKFESCKTDRGIAWGFRHELKDDRGRLWATESVLLKESGQSILTTRVHCFQDELGATVTTPKKPYLIKMYLENSFGDTDISLPVSDSPLRLTESDIDLANEILSGNASISMPTIYVSAPHQRNVNLVDIDKLAYDLGGLAHVVSEPSRGFSFRLRDRTQGRNPYNGTIALIVPSKGVVKKFSLKDDGRDNSNNAETPLATEIRNYIAKISSNRPSRFGWDWTLLQSRKGEIKRASLPSDLKSSEVEDFIKTFTAEMHAKDEEILRLSQQIGQMQTSEAQRTSSDVGIINPELSHTIAEIYPGEISDRVRHAIKICCDNESLGLTDRDLAVFDSILMQSEYSGGAVNLTYKIRSAGHDTRTSGQQISSILTGIGFLKTEDGKHIKLTPPANLSGISPVTLAKTPSDFRSGQNQASQISNNLGLIKLK